MRRATVPPGSFAPKWFRRAGAWVMGALAVLYTLFIVFTARRPPAPTDGLAECRALYDSARTRRDSLLADQHAPRGVAQQNRETPTRCFDLRRSLDRLRGQSSP